MTRDDSGNVTGGSARSFRLHVLKTVLVVAVLVVLGWWVKQSPNFGLIVPVSEVGLVDGSAD